MTDQLTTKRRSELMARVPNKNTLPEMRVRRALHAAGLRFRLHRRDLPGTPDLVLPRFRIAVLVHGCFWHGHSCPRGARPRSNVAFWNKKLDRNISRDRSARDALGALGWQVHTIWECAIDDGVDRILQGLQASAETIEVVR